MKTFHLVIKDFLSSGKIEKARSAQGAPLCPRFTMLLRNILSRGLTPLCQEKLLFRDHPIAAYLTGVWFTSGHFLKPIPFCRAGIGLQNIRSWLWFPAQLRRYKLWNVQ